MRMLTLAVFPSIVGMQPIRTSQGYCDHICGQFIVTNVWGVAIGMALLWSGMVLPWNGELGIEGYPWTQKYMLVVFKSIHFWWSNSLEPIPN